MSLEVREPDLHGRALRAHDAVEGAFRRIFGMKGAVAAPEIA